MSKITKKQKKLQELLADFQQPASGRDALTKLQEVSKEVAKFNETVECHMRLGIEVKHAEQQIRSTVVLPAGLGKEVRVCVIAKGPKVTEAKDAGADFYGTEEIIDKIAGVEVSTSAAEKKSMPIQDIIISSVTIETYKASTAEATAEATSGKNSKTDRQPESGSTVQAATDTATAESQTAETEV